MIRYKKRSLQQGGQAPASSYASGANAFQATNQAGAAGAFKGESVGPVILPGNRGDKSSSGRSSGGGVGKQMFSNAMSQNLLKSKNLKNLTAERNRELQGIKEEMLKKYSIKQDYFASPEGIKEVNAYKVKYTEYDNQLKHLENLYSTVAKGKNLNQTAVTQQNKIFVKNKTSHQVESISLSEFAKDLKKGDEGKYSSAMTMGQLLATIDDIKNYTNNKNDFTNLLTQASAYNSSDTEAVTKFILGNIKNEGKVKATADGIVFNNEATLSNDEMSNYIPGDPKDGGIMDTLVEQQLQGNGEVSKEAFQNLISSDTFEKDLMDASNVDSFIDSSIRKRVWNTIQSGLKYDGKSSEEVAADAEVLDHANRAVSNNKWMQADTGWFGSTKTNIDDVFSYYDENGKEPSQVERVTTTTANKVGNSAGDMHDEYMAATSGDNPIIEQENFKLSDFKSLSTYGDVDMAVFPDGTLVKDSPLANNNGFLPIKKDIVSVTLPVTTDKNGNDKIAMWSMSILSLVQKKYQGIYDDIETSLEKKDLSMFSEEAAADGEIDVNEKKAYINNLMSKEYPELLAKITSGNNNSKDIPATYAELLNKKFRLSQFYKVDVVGVMKDESKNTWEDSSIAKFMTPNLTEDAKMAVTKYGMQENTYDWNRDTVMSTILVPQHYSVEDADFNKAAKFMGEQMRKGSDNLEWNDLLDAMSTQGGFDISITKEKLANQLASK